MVPGRHGGACPILKCSHHLLLRVGASNFFRTIEKLVCSPIEELIVACLLLVLVVNAICFSFIFVTDKKKKLNCASFSAYSKFTFSLTAMKKCVMFRTGL